MVFVVGSETLESCMNVIIRPAFIASPLQDTLHQNGIVAYQVQRQLWCSAQFHQIVSILQRSRKTIQQHPLARMIPHDPAHQRNNHGRRDKFTLFHDFAHLATQDGIPADFVSQ
jgi:hypothetical protein